MKKICLFFILLLFPFIVKAEDLNLAENAKSAIMIETTTGEILYSKNPHEKLAPASMTKMMSLIIIMENIEKEKLSWNDTIVVSKNAASMGGSQIYLEENELMSVEDLIKGICIASGNDATVALAEKIAGTESSFVSLMNKKASELGLKDTHFVNSTGLDADNHYSSAYDMAMIAKELVKHEKILEYSSIYEDYLRNNSFWLVNTNKLVKFYSYIDGLKTGYTSDAGYCLTATGKKKGMRLVTVVMGEESTDKRTKDTISMMDYGFNMYNLDTIIKKDEELGTIDIKFGTIKEVPYVSTRSITLLNNNNGKEKKLTYNITKKNVIAPIEKDTVVGNINVYIDGNYQYSVDLIAKEPVQKASIITIFLRNILDIISLLIK